MISVTEQAQQLLQPIVFGPVTEVSHLNIKDQLRERHASLQLDEAQVRALPHTDLSGEFVFVRVFIEDIMESDIFIGAVINEATTLYPLGMPKHAEEGKPIYFDRSQMRARVCLSDRLCVPTQEKVILSYQLHFTNLPKVFNVVDIYGQLEQFEDQKIINVLKIVPIQPKLEKTYEQFVQYLYNELQDKVCAEFIALTILNGVIHEIYGEDGRQVLNISGMTKEQAQRVKNLISNCVSPVTNISLDQQHLKEPTLSVKDLDRDAIITGVLTSTTNIQSTIIIDETLLQEGKIDGVQLQNINNIQKFVTHSKLGIDYTYSVLEIPVQTSVIILSTAKTFLNHHIRLQYKPTGPAVQQNPLVFDHFVNFIQGQQSQVDISDEVKMFINQRYVELRKTDTRSDANSLNRWIAFMKILSIAHGSMTADYKYFEEAIKQDIERL